jgi:Zn-dependent protease
MRLKKWHRMGGLRIFHAPVYVHSWVLIATAVICLAAFRDVLQAALLIACYLSVITLHEIGHAFVARRRGLEVLSISIGPLHGRCEFQAPENEWDEVLVAWGGVGVQLIVAIPILICEAIFPAFSAGPLGVVILVLGYVNLVIALFNLAPVRGMDGEIAWRIVPLLRKPSRPKRSPASKVTPFRRK